MTMKFRFSSEMFHARLRRKLTQEQAAELLDISVRWYQMLEKGEYLPSSQLLLRILAEFEIDGKRLKEDQVFSEANAESEASAGAFGGSKGA